MTTKYRARLKDISRDWKSGRPQVTFEVIDGDVTETQLYAEQDISLEIKKWSKRRSLDANALMWACIGEIATALPADRWDVYLMMLKKYGRYEYVCVAPTAVEDLKRQWREIEVCGPLKINGHDAVQLLCFYGSSTYTAEEFRPLLEGIISEMKQMQIPAPTENEVQRSIDKWENQSSSKT